MKKHVGRFTLIMLFVASTAIGMDAPSEMRLSRIQEGGRLLNLPRAELTVPAGQPRPDVVTFHFGANGAQIPVANALDGTIRGASDARIVEGNVTCSAFLGRLSMPTEAPLTTRPQLASRTFSFQSGRQVTIQQVVINSTVWDRYNTSTDNQIICYKVGAAPLTVADLKQALGSGLRLEFSQDQSAALESMQRIRQTLGQSLSGLGSGRSPAIVEDNGGVKPGAPGTPAADAVVDEQSTGSFLRRPLK